MYARKSHKLVSCLMVVTGTLGAALRVGLAVYATDWQGLIPAFHPVGIGTCAAVAVIFALALYQSLKLQPVENCQENFPKSPVRFLGHLLGALGILATVLLNQPAARGTLATAWKLLGIASAPCLTVAGWLRMREKRPFFLLHLCPGLFLVAHTISQYQTWSSDPQLLHYGFFLLNAISTVFFAFYQSVFDVELNWRRRVTFFGLTTIGLGIMTLPGSAYPWLNVGMVLWALMDRPVPSVRRRRWNPITEEAPE